MCKNDILYIQDQLQYKSTKKSLAFFREVLEWIRNEKVDEQVKIFNSLTLLLRKDEEDSFGTFAWKLT